MPVFKGEGIRPIIAHTTQTRRIGTTEITSYNPDIVLHSLTQAIQPSRPGIFSVTSSQAVSTPSNSANSRSIFWLRRLGLGCRTSTSEKE